MPISPKLPCGKKQIKMGHRLERILKAHQLKSCLKQRNIECYAVISDSQFESAELFTERQERGGFFIEVGDEVLHHVEMVARKIDDADKERTDDGADLCASRISVAEYHAVTVWKRSLLSHQLHQVLENG